MGVIADSYQSMLRALLPPGRLWRFIDRVAELAELPDSLLTGLLAGSADELERVHVRAYELLAESNPAAALELLPEYEEELDIPSTGTLNERSARVVAHTVAEQGFRPEDFQTTLATLLGLAAADVVVLERTPAISTAQDDGREIFRFFIYRNPALAGTYYLASAQALVDTIKPSHTIGHAIESINCLCDDPLSLCDRDLLGA